MNTESAIDLSMRSRSPSESESDKVNNVSIVRPIPRPPWSIIWYQNLWPSYGNTMTQNTTEGPISMNQRQGSPYRRTDCSEKEICETQIHTQSIKKFWKRKQGDSNPPNHPSSKIKAENEQNLDHPPVHQQFSQCESKDGEGTNDSENNTNDEGDDEANQMATIVDIACCDGPVRFERISNPNFALTVEHQNDPIPINNSTPSILLEPTCRNLATKTYLCIYCNQSFKSLFCYQKHKKRHLNPVSVDITGINVNTPMVCTPENKIKTKDLNVQFFPCKKCGCKFPSYYFVHKHKKTCH